MKNILTDKTLQRLLKTVLHEIEMRDDIKKIKILNKNNDSGTYSSPFIKKLK